MRDEFTLHDYTESGQTLYGIRNETTGRVYGPYWKREHAEALLKNCLRQGPRSRRTVAALGKWAVALVLTAPTCWITGVDIHLFAAMVAAGLFFSILEF